MPDVNSGIESILGEKDLAIKSGVQSMLELLEELQNQVQTELGQAALGSWDAYQLKNMLETLEQQINQFSASSKAEISDRLDGSWGLGIDLVDKTLASIGIDTGFHISTSSLDTLKDFAFHRLDNLCDDMWLKIKGELTLGILGGKTPQEVAEAIKLILGSSARRAEVITKTEMGRVFSQATQLRMEQAAKYVEGLKKQWLHAGHPKKARPTHLAADGQIVPVKEPFKVGGILMLFPREPGAPLDEVIGCGCDHIPYHESW